MARARFVAHMWTASFPSPPPAEERCWWILDVLFLQRIGLLGMIACCSASSHLTRPGRGSHTTSENSHAFRSLLMTAGAIRFSSDDAFAPARLHDLRRRMALVRWFSHGRTQTHTVIFRPRGASRDDLPRYPKGCTLQSSRCLQASAV